MELIRGPQDGYHVWVSARAYNWDPGVESILDVQLETRWLGVPESEVSGSGLVSALLGVDEAGVEIRDMLGWPAAIHRPQCAHGQVLSVRVSFLPVWEQGASSGAPGTMWTGEITARVNVPEDYRLRDCL